MKILLNEKIRQLCKNKGVSLKVLAENIDISQTGLQGILKNNSTTIETLFNISKFFKVSVYDFFEPETEQEENEISVLQSSEELKLRSQSYIEALQKKNDDYLEKIGMLEQQLSLSKDLISNQTYLIEVLKKQIENSEKAK